MCGGRAEVWVYGGARVCVCVCEVSGRMWRDVEGCGMGGVEM